MSIRDVQKLKDQPARPLGDGPPPPLPAERSYEDEALLRRLHSVKQGASASLAAVLKDVETALQARTAQLAAVRRNYENLHTICEEYHVQLDALKGRVVGAAKVTADMEELRKQALLAASVEARARSAETQLREAESQINTAKDQLIAQTTALQESSKANKRLTAALKVAEQRATQAVQEAETAVAAKEAERKALARLTGAEAHIQRMREGSDSMAKELESLKRGRRDAAREAQALAAEQLVRAGAEAAARTASLAESEVFAQKLRAQAAETSVLAAEVEHLRASQAQAAAAAAADTARLEQELRSLREAEREARGAALAAREAEREARGALAAAGARAAQAASGGAADAEAAGLSGAAAAAAARCGVLEHELAELRGTHEKQAVRVVESDRARNALQARVRELESRDASRDASRAASMPSLGELQLQALHGELEGWRIVAREAQDAKAKLEEDLAVARRELRTLGHVSAAAAPELSSGASLGRLVVPPLGGARSRSGSRGFLLPRGPAGGAA